MKLPFNINMLQISRLSHFEQTSEGEKQKILQR
jgi:hypothetical protein